LGKEPNNARHSGKVTEKLGIQSYLDKYREKGAAVKLRTLSGDKSLL